MMMKEILNFLLGIGWLYNNSKINRKYNWNFY